MFASVRVCVCFTQRFSVIDSKGAGPEAENDRTTTHTHAALTHRNPAM